ncbi:MAG: tyrosine-type recombinase/integrase [Nannocystaceae bacterium]
MSSLTTATVADLRPASRPYEVTCARLPGFMVRVLPTGKKVFLVRCRDGGRDRRVRLGLFGPKLSVDDARRQAMAILAGGSAELAEGEEVEAGVEAEVVDVPAPGPAPGRGRGRAQGRVEAREGASTRRAPAPRQRSAAPLQPAREPRRLHELAERFVDEYVDIYLKPKTATVYRLTLRLEILPRFGDRDFETITRSDAKALHAALARRPSRADSALNVLGSLYTRIINDWELSDMRHPTVGVKRFGSRKVERFLSPEERQALDAVLDAGLAASRGKPGHLEPFSVWAIRLLMFTGFRKDEILSLTWPMIDWQHALIHFPDTKTGQRTSAVSEPVIELLREIHRRTGAPKAGLVIRGLGGRRLGHLNRTWDEIRVAAGIPDVRIHDLRHSFASDALMAGVPLAVVGELLGHRQASTTQRYAHLADRVVREGLNVATQRILEVTRGSGEGRGEVAFRRLSDEEWARVAPVVEPGRGRRGPPVELRRIVDGIRWVLAHKAKWREVPAEFGTATTCWRWYRRWVEDGRWVAVLGGPATSGAQ